MYNVHRKCVLGGNVKLILRIELYVIQSLIFKMVKIQVDNNQLFEKITDST